MTSIYMQNSGRAYAEIGPEHVGQPLFRAFGRVWDVSGFIGRVLPQDVGKRVYLRGGVLQVENNKQRAERLEK